MYLFSSSPILLTMILHDPIETRFGCHIHSLIRQSRQDLMRRQAGMFRPIHDLNNRCSLCLCQLMGRLWSYRARSPVRGRVLPSLIGPQRDTQSLAGFEPSSPGYDRLLNQGPGPQAILDRDQSSSPSPQIAFAFFLRMIRAAASASAASFRFSSRSNSLMRRADCFSFSLVYCWRLSA